MKQKIADNFFYILVRSWNAYDNFDRCIDSILKQSYDHYQILFVDDNSKYSAEQKLRIKKKLHGHIVIFNKKRKYSVRNAYEMIHRYAKKSDAIILNLDGDDSLFGTNVLSYLNTIYKKTSCLYTYGECYLVDKEITRISKLARQFTNTVYPVEIIKSKSFRLYPFLPLHPRSWRVHIFKSIPKKEFMVTNNQWFKFCEDMVIFFPMLEREPYRCEVLKKPLYNYNMTEFSDIVKNMRQTIEEEILLRRRIYSYTMLQKRNAKQAKLFYSKVLNVPFLSHSVYIFQILLLKVNLLNVFVAANFDNRLRDILFFNLSQKYETITCTSEKFGYNLKKLSSEIHLCTEKKDFHSQAEYYQHMWSHVLAKKISYI